MPVTSGTIQGSSALNPQNVGGANIARGVGSLWPGSVQPITASMYTVIGAIKIMGAWARIAAEILNAGPGVWQDFQIQGQTSPNGDWITYIPGSVLSGMAGASPPAPIAGLCNLVTADPTVLAAGANALICFETNGLYAVQFVAQGAATDSGGSVIASGSR